ncbi:MAG: alpha/beta hydrolase [Bacteroidota bacterium]
MNRKIIASSLITLFYLTFVHSNYAQSVAVDGTKIEYRVYGDGDTTLVFIHGWAIDQSYWQSQVDHFHENYQVVTLDLAGHGQSESDREDWTIPAFGKDVLSVIDTLHLTNVVIIGHSMGGDVMLEAATQIPERIIALVGVDNFKDVGTLPSEEERKQTESVFEMMETNFAEVVDGYARSMLFTPESDSLLVASVAQDMKSANQAMAISSIKHLFGYVEREIDLLEQSSAKLYLIQSDALPTDTVALTQHAAKGFEIFSVGEVSHYPMVEIPEVFNNTLEVG